MEMNYSKIVIDGCSEFVKSKTSFESYFKREAKINERDNFIEFADFFNGCMEVVKKFVSKSVMEKLFILKMKMMFHSKKKVCFSSSRTSRASQITLKKTQSCDACDACDARK